MDAHDRLETTRRHFLALQDRYCAALAGLDGRTGFREDAWKREGGGGGRSRVIQDGAVFEKGGVNFSDVHGSLAEDFAATLPGAGTAFRATGISLVLHPLSPYVPTVHMNLRCLRRGPAVWFGGGIDLTPWYVFPEDARHFHGVLRDACNRHAAREYGRFKRWCDEYFYVRHRGEARGIGGIFFDYLSDDLDRVAAMVRDVGDAFLPAYAPIVERRADTPWGEREREWQLIRRGRYVEFNLVYDRGTVFGLKTKGRTESILMSLPPMVRWVYAHEPEPGSAEARSVAMLQPRDWLTEE